jgi:hypothetical protein
MSSPSATAMPSEAPDLAVRPVLVTQPGLAIHVGADVMTTPEHVPWPGVRSCRDTLERTSRLAAAAGITRQRRLLGLRASRAGVRHALRHAAAELDPRGHLLVTFTGHSDRALPPGDGPPEVSWSLYDGALPLAQVAALLAVLPPTARITMISDTGYAAALSAFHIPATVVLLAACGADQEIMPSQAASFAARLEQLMLRDGRPNPDCVSYRWLNWQLRQDVPDAERPRVWINRPALWSQRPWSRPAQ